MPTQRKQNNRSKEGDDRMIFNQQYIKTVFLLVIIATVFTAASLYFGIDTTQVATLLLPNTQSITSLINNIQFLLMGFEFLISTLNHF